MLKFHMSRNLIYMAISLLFLFMPAPVWAGDDSSTIVVDSDNPPASKPIKADKSTKVISLKGKRSTSEGGTRRDSGDVCVDLKRSYYCKSLGRQAWLTINGMYLGTIDGVAWKDAGQPTGAYLGDLASGRPIAEWVIYNHLARSGVFYFIITIDNGTL